MRLLLKFYHYINVLSLDVVAGAVIGCLFFAGIFEVSVSFFSLAALALTVWIIYTLDHLRDAMFISQMASTDRHRFHQEYFRRITAMLLLIVLVDLVLIWFVPERVLVAGVALSIMIAIYLGLQRYLKFLKEFFVAGLYTAGILLPSIIYVMYDLHPIDLLLPAMYFVLAWMNLLLFSLIDFSEDQKHRQYSFVTCFGPASTRYTILTLGLLNLATGVWLLHYDANLAVILIAMNFLLLTILFFQEYFVANNYYRIAGDAVFFIPLSYLLWIQP